MSKHEYQALINLRDLTGFRIIHAPIDDPARCRFVTWALGRVFPFVIRHSERHLKGATRAYLKENGMTTRDTYVRAVLELWDNGSETLHYEHDDIGQLSIEAYWREKLKTVECLFVFPPGAGYYPDGKLVDPQDDIANYIAEWKVEGRQMWIVASTTQLDRQPRGGGCVRLP